MGEIVSIKYKNKKIKIDDGLLTKIMDILSVEEWEKFDSPPKEKVL